MASHSFFLTSKFADIGQYRGISNQYLVRAPCASASPFLAFRPGLSSRTDAVAHSGPLIIKGFGFDSRKTILLNIPFGFVQSAVCILGCLFAARYGYKGLVLVAFMLPCILGSGLLYGKFTILTETSAEMAG